MRVDVWPGSTFTGQPGSVQQLQIPVAGDYKVRIKLSGLKPPGGRAPHLAVYAADLDRMLFEQDVVAPEDKPVTVEFQTHFTAGNARHPHRPTSRPGRRTCAAPGAAAASRSSASRTAAIPGRRKLTDEEGKPIVPFLIVDWVEWEGPILPRLSDARAAAVSCRRKTGDLAKLARCSRGLPSGRSAVRLEAGGSGAVREAVESEMAERREVRRPR